MSIRIRTILVIILTNLIIILVSVTAGINFVEGNIKTSQETDLLLIADMADRFISSEIDSLKLKALKLVHDLEVFVDTEWSGFLSSQQAQYPEFIGMAILDADRGVITSVGELPATAEIMETRYVTRAFFGATAFSSTTASNIGMVFYLAVPFQFSEGKILVFTLPGMYFSRLVSTFVIWETGHIFIDDGEGYVIANIRENWVQDRHNFIKLAEADNHYEGIASVIRRIVSGETGIDYFSLYGVPRLCAFRPVTASQEGWALGIIAPLPESPFRNIDRGLLVAGLLGFILGVIAAIVASGFIKKPFEAVAALKEEAELNSQYKSNFLANMSHEMRTPLNVVVGLTDLQLEDGKAPVEVETDLKKINSAGELLLGIVNDVLDISKIESGKLELVPVNYNTASLLNDITTLNMVRFQSKPVKFSVDISESFPNELYGDELRVKQIFNNLLSNAFKYTKEGTVTLHLESERISEKDIMVSVTVSDTGMGIRTEDIKTLFSAYNQVDVKANRKIEGTGLGLSITKNLVEMMDGNITVESVYGTGASFHVSIKQGFVDDKVLGRVVVEKLRDFCYSEQKQEASNKLVRPDLSYARVLVVDDFPTNLDVASGMLRKYKMQVDCLSNGQDAINLIKAGKPVYDAIFMDHMMPEMDGIEATKIIRSLDTEYAKTVPIISLTANALVGNEQMFLANGFNAFLSKPINIFYLDSVVKKWVRKKTTGPIHPENLPGPSGESQVPESIKFSIPGVNAAAGLSLYDGDEEIYISVMRSFHTNLLEVIEKLVDVSEESLPEYIIKVHGIKSICAGIGAKQLSGAAADLEMKAKAGDLSAVLLRNETFLEEAKILADDVFSFLDGHDKANPKPQLKGPDRVLLALLRKSCETYDMKTIDETMEKLESFSYENDSAMILWLREKINASDFSSVVSRLSEHEA